MATGQVTLASLLGPAGISASQHSGTFASSGVEGTNGAFVQVLGIIAALQGRLQENEATIADLQATSDNMDEKCRSLKRRAERADCDLGEAEKWRDDLEAAVASARTDAAPLLERYMEAEVLQSQLRAEEDDVTRLRNELDMCQDEIAIGQPRLSEAEGLAAELSQAIGDMEAAHQEEVAKGCSSHVEELEDLRNQHALHFTQTEAARLAALSDAEVGSSEDVQQLRTAVEEARWQGEVYTREQQDAIRESCIRQRENSRLSKRHGEARQEALELAVKLEAMRAADAGAPAREAELHIVRQRCALLKQTASEWREALERKNDDCFRWRQRATQQGKVGAGEPEEEGLDSKPSSPIRTTSTLAGNSILMSAQVPALDWQQFSPSLGSREHGLWARVPTPTRTPHHTDMSERSAGNINTMSPLRPSASWEDSGGLLIPVHSVRESAKDFIVAAVQAAQVWAEAEVISKNSSANSPSPELALGDSAHVLPLGIDPRSRLGVDLVEAENELEMLTFLLDEGAALEAEALLEQEVGRQPLLVARRLHKYLEELCRRRGVL